MAINNILCVDDDPSLRKILKRHFQAYLAPNVDVAEDYDSGLEKIKSTRYDLIVLDGLNGDCFKIYDDIKDVSHGDVIIFSADSRIEDKAKQLKISFYSKSNPLDSVDRIVAKYKNVSE